MVCDDNSGDESTSVLRTMTAQVSYAMQYLSLARQCSPARAGLMPSPLII